MPDTEFQHLTTARLVLRRFQPGDLDALVAYRADPDVARYQGWGPGFGRADGEAFLRWTATVDPDTPGEWFQFAIERVDTPGLIGDCAARFGDGEVEIGVTLAVAHQRRGYATEALSGLLAYLRRRGHQRFVAHCDPANDPVQRLLARLGFEPRADRDTDIEFSLSAP